MKRIAPLGGVVAALMFIGVAGNAVTITEMENVSATVESVASLTSDLKLIADDSDVTSGVMAFGSVASTVLPWDTIPPQYVSLAVNNNSISWRLRLTTKNFTAAPSTTTWGFSYGGLISTPTVGGKVPFGWRASTITDRGYVPTAGNPGADPTVGWTFVKDQQDQDAPDFPDGTFDPDQDQSFAWVDANTGYCNIAYGSASGTNVVALSDTLTTATLLETSTGTFKLFIEGNFNGAPAASYGEVLADDPVQLTSKDMNKLQLDLIYQ